jgi:hypothetical protein
VVVEELRRLVEERGVVLVALDDELRAGAIAEAAAEVLGEAADEQRRIASSLEQQRRDLVVRFEVPDANRAWP